MEINPRFYRGKKNSFSMSKTSYCGILVKVWRPHYQSNRRFYADKERRKKRDKKHITFKIPLPVSHRICTEVSKKRDLWAVEKGHRRNTADIVQAKECGNTGGRGVCRSHTYVGEYSAVFKCSTVHGISQGKEQDDWLFYANTSDGDPISCYQGTNLFSEEDLKNIVQNCINQRDFLEVQGKEFAIFIAPNKERVYSEYMQDKYGEPAENYRALQVYNPCWREIFLASAGHIYSVAPHDLMAKRPLGKEP